MSALRSRRCGERDERHHCSPFLPSPSQLATRPSGRARALLTSLPGMTPPQKPTSTLHWPFEASIFSPRLDTVVVGGIALSGMSITVVTPPDAAACAREERGERRWGRGGGGAT